MSLLTINKDRLDELVESILGFTESPQSEKDIVELVEARSAIEDTYKKITEALKEKMTAKGLSSVEGDVARISVSQAGFKYLAKDPKEVDPDFLDLKLNMKAIAAFEKENGALPKNVEYNPKRSFSCRITIKGGAND